MASSQWTALATAGLTPAQCILAAVAVAILAVLYRFSPARIDPREPPPLKASIPLIGHIIGLLRHGIDYFAILRTAQSNKPAAATLPILDGKIYVLWDVPLIQSALRHKNLTFDVLSMEFAQRVFGLSDLAMEKLWGPEHEIETSVAPIAMHRIKGAMQSQHLFRMNTRALNYVADELNALGPEGLRIPNLYRWLRDFMTMATSDGIYGSQNPVREDPSLIDALWDFETNMQPLFLGVLPSVIARKAVANREKVVKALVPWYQSGKDSAPDVAEIAKVRAQSSREFGMPEDEIGRLEMALLFVATTNTIPTLYWFTVFVWLRPQVVEDICRETLPLVGMTTEEGRRVATVDITKLEEQCPLMVSCYREAIRLGNQGFGTRRIIQDTVLTDGEGREYLFKKGVDMMWAAKALHRSAETWGPDAMEFGPERFKEQDKFDRNKKHSYIPFGGGKHLCPGRNFAFAENLGFMAALVVGFEVLGLKEGNVKLGTANVGEAVAKPPAGAEGGEVSIKRKKGWEDVEWRFVC
ncbi:cytochrome P450 [Podospora conica]|nr:cytochrome P450 [Schizothecium conicum]